MSRILILLGILDLNGQGNGLNNVISGNDGNNTLQGNGGADTPDGGAGNDTLEGGAGNDTFVVNDGDTVVETANNGIDQVISTVTFSLANIPYVEKPTLTGTADIDGVGNGSANTRVGNAGDNAMSGGVNGNGNSGNNDITGTGVTIRWTVKQAPILSAAAWVTTLSSSTT